MPVQRVSKHFKDISMSFKYSPINQDLIGIKNEVAISRSVRNLILTNNGERFFNPLLGSQVNSILFDQVDFVSASSIESEIKTVLKNYEPRIEVLDVVVEPNFDAGEMNVQIRYKIVGIEASAQELSFALQSTR